MIVSFYAHMRRFFLFVAATSLIAPAGGSLALASQGNTPPAKKRVYHDPDFTNLFKLYWKLGVNDVNDISTIEDYILVTECEIVRRYYHNDFEWEKILLATQDYMKEHLNDYTTHFQFIREIELGRYNSETQSFEVVTPEMLKGTRRFETDLPMESICDQDRDLPHFNKNLAITLNRPFNVHYVPMSPDLARDYLARKRAESPLINNQSSPIILGTDIRKVFIRMRIKILKSLGFERNDRGETLTSVFAVLEGYDVFEDEDMTRHIFSSKL